MQRVRFRPHRSPYGPGRPWETKCLEPACREDAHAHTWHLCWEYAIGRVRAHHRDKHGPSSVAV